MDLDKAKQAVAIGTQIDGCNALLLQLQTALDAKGVLVKATVLYSDGTNRTDEIIFPPGFDATPIGQSLISLLQNQLKTLQTALAAL